MLGMIAPYLVIAVMGLGIWGLLEEHKNDRLKIDAQQAVIDQNNADKIRSASQIARLETKLETLDVKAQPIIQQIMAAPVTKGCGPVVRTALDGVKILREGGNSGQPTPLGSSKSP